MPRYCASGDYADCGGGSAGNGATTPMFSVQSGPCTLDEGGRCVVSQIRRAQQIQEIHDGAKCAVEPCRRQDRGAERVAVV